MTNSSSLASCGTCGYNILDVLVMLAPKVAMESDKTEHFALSVNTVCVN